MYSISSPLGYGLYVPMSKIFVKSNLGAGHNKQSPSKDLDTSEAVNLQQSHISEGGASTATVEFMGNGGNLPLKSLCATPRCSFKGYKELNNSCPDCYREIFSISLPPGFPSSASEVSIL